MWIGVRAASACNGVEAFWSAPNKVISYAGRRVRVSLSHAFFHLGFLADLLARAAFSSIFWCIISY
jgi:hypothetical protein